MGNLCSSGTDRTEKKEDTQLPKTKDGADEALLSKAAEGVEVADADGGGEKKGEGLSGFVGGVTSAGEAALGDAVETAKDQGEKVVTEGKALAAEVVEKGKEVAVESKDAIVAGITGAATGVKGSAEQKTSDAVTDAGALVESGKTAAVDVAGEAKDAVVAGVSSAAADAKESAEKQASSAVSNVKSQVESGQQSVGGLLDNVKSQVTETATDVQTGVQSEVADVKADASSALESGKEQTQSVVAGVADEAAAAKEETLAAVKTSKTEAANVVTGIKDEAATVESSVGESVQEPSSGFMDTVKENVQEVSSNVKETVVEKGQEAKQKAEDYLSQAVDSAKASAMGSFTSASVAAAGAVEGANGATSDAVTSVEQSVENVEKDVAAEIPSVPSNAGELQSAVSSSGVGSSLDALAGDMRSAEECVKEEVEAIKQIPDDLPPPPPSPPALSDVVPPQQSGEPEQQSGSGFLGNLGATATGAVTSGVRMVGDKIADKVEDLTGGQKEKQPVTEAPVEAAQESSVETAPPAAEESSGFMSGIGSSASGAVKTGFDIVSEKIEGKAQDLFGGGKESAESEPPAAPAAVVENTVQSASVGIVEASAPALSAAGGVEKVADELLQSDTKFEAAEELITKSEGQPDVETMPPEEGDFIEKAKSLLEQHRNSVDGNKMANLEDSVVRDIVVDETSEALADLSNNNNTINNTNDNNNNSNDVSEEVSDKAREDTARDFVEGIIDRATSIVSESMVSGDAATQDAENGAGAGEEDSLSSPDPCVDHTEETIAPKKRGVCFASPQPSDQSLSSLSSPPEITPPPVTQEVDLSPPSEASSISQGELVERDIELELPSPPQSTTEESGPSPDEEEAPATTTAAPTTTTTEEQGVLDNQRIQGMEEADESLKRIAMEVTTKAVQDAIKIVTENGTGAGIGNLNDIGVSSPSSAGGGDQEEEMTTTDSSQVERGSSVSDLTDTSQQGSIADSLSSYDPGAVYRQDAVAETPAEASDAPDAATTTSAAAATINSTGESGSENQTTSATADGDNVTDGGKSVVDTPTPTNQTSNADSEPQTDAAADGSNGNNSTEPHAPSPTEVPSTFPIGLNEAMTKQPTIVINSPDSAPNTNGSVEDVTASQTEALI